MSTFERGLGQASMKHLKTKNRPLIWVTCILLLASLASNVYGQDIRLIRKFSALNGDVDVVRNAWVTIWDGNQSKYYEYQDGKYIEKQKLPDDIKQKDIINWNSFDTADQYSMDITDSNIRKLLPVKSRIKNVLAADSKKSDHVFLICFTERINDPGYRPQATNIYIAAVQDASPDGKINPKLLWIKKVESDGSYGLMRLQQTISGEQLLVLYWQDLAGSGSVEGVNVYKIL